MTKAVIVAVLLTTACSSDRGVESIVGPGKLTPAAGPTTDGPSQPSWSASLSGGPTGYNCPGSRFTQQSPDDPRDFRYTVNVTRVDVDFEVLAFAHFGNHATCGQTTERTAPLEIVGQSTFHAGSSGSFSVDVERFGCNAVQIDVQAFNLKTREPIADKLFIAEVLNSGKECAPPTAPIPPTVPEPRVPPAPPSPPVVPPVPPPPPPIVPPPPPDEDPQPNCVYGTDGGVTDIMISGDGSTYTFRVKNGYKNVPLQLVSYVGHEGHLPPDRPQRVVSYENKLFQPGVHSWSITPNACGQTDLYCTASKPPEILRLGDYYPEDGMFIAGRVLVCPAQ